MHKEAITEIAHGLGRVKGINLITLVPNKTGYRHFLALGLGLDGYSHTLEYSFPLWKHITSLIWNDSFSFVPDLSAGRLPDSHFRKGIIDRFSRLKFF